jgi:multidrug efflux pump
MHLYMQPVQDITVDDRVSRTQYQYTLEDPDTDELNEWTDKFVAQLKKLPELEDVATDQQTGARAVQLEIDRVTASRLGIAPTTIDNTLYDAYGQREISTLYTQLNQYHVVLETAPEWQQNPHPSWRSVHPEQRIFGRQRRGRGHIVLLVGLGVGGLECD